MTITNGDLLRCSVVWKYGSADEQINVWHVGVADPAAVETDLLDDIEEYFGWLYAEVVALCTTSLVHDRIEIFNVSQNTPEPWVGQVAALNGASGSDPLPTGVAAMIYARTSQSRVIGKKYMPTWVESVLTAGVWTQTGLDALDDIRTRWGAVYAATHGTDFRSGIYSAAHAQMYYPISSTSVATPAYQRRRKLGRGQ